MFESKKTPGKKFGSSFAGKNYDEKHSSDGMHKLGGAEEDKESPAMEEEEQKQGEEQPDEENEGTVHPVVQEHGPAHTVTIHHDADAGRHTVVSHHKTGHMHTAVHEDAGKAHEEGKKLAGVPADGQAKDHDSPYHQGKDQAGASSENDSFVMPDLV
jgi:hypothetical protein